MSLTENTGNLFRKLKPQVLLFEAFELLIFFQKYSGLSRLTFARSKSTTETLEKGMKYVQS